MHILAKYIPLTYAPMLSSRIVPLYTRNFCNTSLILNKHSHNICYPILSTISFFNRGMSYFLIHPEKLKQIIKEKDSQTMCKIFGSKNYQKHIENSVEQQHMSYDDNLAGIPENEIKYEHVIDCAQPSPKPKVKRVIEKEEDAIEEASKQQLHFKKPVRTTVMNLILEKRKLSPPKVFSNETTKLQESTILPIVMEARKKNMERKKKFRRRTTILPLLLQKKQMREENAKRKLMENESPLTNYFKKRSTNIDVTNDEVGIVPYAHAHTTGRLESARTIMTSTSTNNSVNRMSKAVENSGSTKNPENVAEDDTKAASKVIHRIGQEQKKVQYIAKMTDQWRQSKCVATKKKRRGTKREVLCSGCEMNMPMNNAHFHSGTSAGRSCKANALAMKTIPLEDPKGYQNDLLPAINEDKYPAAAEVLQEFKQRKTCEPSLTYKIVSGNRKRRRMKLYRQFRIAKKTIPDKMEKLVRKYDEVLATCLGQLPSDDVPIGNTHMARLPKTTPEGYRVLLYSVRDNDPTKMSFTDAVKGFCMYNDCVLSEDGLQEGYIVIFDMKGVQIGHLARVSLPALRCFMLYIQEGHPCRLKSIHILNTASWIHHVMRLVIPLVKSELLNMVKFHKGNVPEGLPLDILPMDYGGEAPSIEDLDRETETLVQNYHQWMIESEQFKSDESKRVKKASWWGLFNGSKTNDVELDEKTILKNLQID